MKAKREHWATRVGFIMAALGSAIGLGTLWKFPYVTGESGGGLFVLVYLGCTLFIGIPVFIAELLLGRRAQRGVVGIFSTLSEKGNWRAVGFLAVLAPILILSYYHVVAGWGLNYVFLSLVQFSKGKTPAEIQSVFDLLFQSGAITLFFLFLFTAIVVAMVYQGVQKGIEYWSRIMTVSLFVLLIGLLFYSMTLEGFGDAVRFVFKPDLSKMRPSTILTALGLAFFTLSLAHGVMLTYGSYLTKGENVPRVALIVAGSDIVVSLLAALMIFPIIFTFGLEADQGAGLVFKTLPVLFARLPGTLVISTAFFVLFVFTALTSAIAMLEVIAANFMDLYKWPRGRAAIISGAIVFVLGIPCALSGSGTLFGAWPEMYNQTYFQTIDNLVNTWILPLGGLFTALFAGWMVKREHLAEEYRAGASMRLFSAWHFFVRWVVPIAVILVILQNVGVIDVDRWVRG
ncbi:MAG: sodium-dependent transporter [Parachlamydiales bacterium]